MSAYADTNDFERYGIRRVALNSSVTDDDINAAISAASSMADGYLSPRFRLPLVSWGDDLKQRVCSIAAFELVSAKVGFNPDSGHNVVLLDRKNDAIRWLENISRGMVTPILIDTAPMAVTVGRVFSRTPRGW